MDLTGRIKEVLKFSGLTTRAFAIKCGMNQPTFDRMLKGINAINLNCIISILATFPEISAEWLTRGDGEMLKVQNEDPNMERVLKLVDTINTLQDALNAKTETITTLQERIKQLENQLKTK